MGSVISTPGVERIFDGTIERIDLRLFTKTNRNTNVCNTFYVSNSNYFYLFIEYLTELWYLGRIVEKKFVDEHNPNESIVLMDSGREYIIHDCLPVYDKPTSFKRLEMFIANTIMFSPRCVKISSTK